MVAANVVKSRLPADRVIQMHGSSARHEKHMLDAVISQKPEYVVRNFNHSIFELAVSNPAKLFRGSLSTGSNVKPGTFQTSAPIAG